MTRKECIEIIEDAKQKLTNNELPFMTRWKYQWVEEVYGIFLAADIDPDSCFHHSEIKEGKGTRFIS